MFIFGQRNKGSRNQCITLWLLMITHRIGKIARFRECNKVIKLNIDKLNVIYFKY